MPESLARAQNNSCMHGTTLEHGSIFPSGPQPVNPPKRYVVANVQQNYHSLLFVERKTEIPVCLRTARLLSPRLCVGGFTPRFGKFARFMALSYVRCHGLQRKAISE